MLMSLQADVLANNESIAAVEYATDDDSNALTKFLEILYFFGYIQLYISVFIMSLPAAAEVSLQIFKIKLSDCFSNMYSIRSSVPQYPQSHLNLEILFLHLPLLP